MSELQNIGRAIKIWIDKSAVLNSQKQEVEILSLARWELGLKVG